MSKELNKIKASLRKKSFEAAIFNSTDKKSEIKQDSFVRLEDALEAVAEAAKVHYHESPEQKQSTKNGK